MVALLLAFYIPLPPVGEPLSLELSLPSFSLPCLRSSLIRHWKSEWRRRRAEALDSGNLQGRVETRHQQTRMNLVIAHGVVIIKKVVIVGIIAYG